MSEILQHGGCFRYRAADGSVSDYGVSAKTPERLRVLADEQARIDGAGEFMNAHTYCCGTDDPVEIPARRKVYTAKRWAEMEANAERLRKSDPLLRS